MSTPLSKLRFQKLNATTCIITVEEGTIYNSPNPFLDIPLWTANENEYMQKSRQELKTTSLLFLCDLLVKNKIPNTLIDSLKIDLNKTEVKHITSTYPNSEIVNKYIAAVEVLKYNPSSCNIDDMLLSDGDKEQLKTDVLNAKLLDEDNNELPLYELFDEEEESTFVIDILRNLERLQKYMSWEQVLEIFPGYKFKVILKDTYLKSIESIPPIESVLDTYLSE